MAKPDSRRIVADHETLEVAASRVYQPYDHLVLRTPKGRAIWTVLLCEPAGEGWTVTAIKCPPRCRLHHRRR